MKRRVLITLLAMTMTAAMITGCGKPNQSQAAETNQEAAVEASDESTVPSSQPETQASDSNQTPSEAPTETSQEAEPSKETPKPDTKPTADTAATSQADNTNITTPAVSAPVATVQDPVTPAEQPQAPAYTVTDMNATMYVKNTVNLRQGPGTDYSKVGSLNKGDQVTVTGQADNGWYQLDSGAFISNKYLTSDAPVATVAATPGTTAGAAVIPTEQTAVVNPLDILNVSPYVANASEFFDYLNQQRSAAGLCTLTWDGDMAAVAQRRAKELATDFSHNGNTERYNENIHTTNDLNSTYVDWYNSFYNSKAHRETMMNPNIGRGAAALYFDGRNYYVICNFQGNPISAEELLEQFNPDNMVQISDNAYIGKDDYEAMINAGIDPRAQPDDEGLKKIEEQKKLAEEGLIEVPSLN